MASITLPAGAVQSGALRPLNILRDLPQVADLIEQCFESTMDDEGQTYLQEMRRASRDKDFLRWAGRVMESTSMPLAGYVWEEGGKIVGNASLVFQSHHGRKIAMIANVATEPTYRRRGIGRALTERSMAGAMQKGAREIWLQVRDDNPTAIHIYEGLGFVDRARRTTYKAAGGKLMMPTTAAGGSATKSGPPVAVGRPNARHWTEQLEWLERAHPYNLSWYARWDWKTLGPGLRNAVQRLLAQPDARQWAATRDGNLLATVSWIPTVRVANALWLAAPSGGDGDGIKQVLEAARRQLTYYHKLTVEYPAGEMVEAIESAGFSQVRTLVWMEAPATAPSPVRINARKET
jgi:ribosomal protein S18 acetylase RimI-like enzyme